MRVKLCVGYKVFRNHENHGSCGESKQPRLRGCQIRGKKISQNRRNGFNRSAAYAARWLAKNVVAAGLATKCQVQLAYAIGVADPVSINVETYGTEIGVTREQIQQAVRKVFDLRPAAIIDELDLKRPIYSKTAAYGHFGREDADFTWEATNKVDELKEAIKA